MNKTLETIINRRSEIKDIDSFRISRTNISSIIEMIETLLFRDYYESELSDEELLARLKEKLNDEIKKVDVNYENITDNFIEELPVIQDLLYKDVQAIYDGDPSAKTFTEIIMSFPGFKAVMLYRIGHELYDLNVPIIPRIIAEYAHEITGIDINPGAKIGEYFCIDHGTGIVIGETATIGDHVRMYHGVTLGVRNFRKDENGNLLKGGKRHPDVGNNVIIYANATILGGDTVIEDNSVIPANSLILQTPEKFK